MKQVVGAVALCVAVLAGEASAQVVVNLTGRYRCIQMCAPGLQGQFAFITQSGYDLNLVNDAGEPSRGWIDYPGRIWVERANQGAVYSADGMTIQFDRGTVWQRMPDELLPAVRRR